MLVETKPNIFDKSLGRFAPKKQVFFSCKASEQFPAAFVETEPNIFVEASGQISAEARSLLNTAFQQF